MLPGASRGTTEATPARYHAASWKPSAVRLERQEKRHVDHQDDAGRLIVPSTNPAAVGVGLQIERQVRLEGDQYGSLLVEQDDASGGFDTQLVTNQLHGMEAEAVLAFFLC